MNVLITTIVSLNPGDAAILQGTLAILRQAFGDEVKVTVVDRDGDAAQHYYPWAAFRRSLFSDRKRNSLLEWLKRRGYLHRVRQLDALRYHLGGRMLQRRLTLPGRLLLSREERETLRSYVEADLVIANGGTYLVEHYNLHPPLLDYELVLSLGKPLVFFPQSLGPFRTTPYRPRLARVFRSATAVFLRDHRSASHLRELGLPEAAVRVPGDVAFALGATDAAPPRNRPGAGAPRIAVSVREWHHYRENPWQRGQDRYEAALAEAIAAVVRRRGAEVTFMSTCQGMKEYWTDDATVARRIAERLPDDVAGSIRVDEDFREPLELVRAYAGFDAVVATRMHAAILSMCAGVPALAIAYEFKTLELYESLGLSEWVVDINDAEPESLSSLLDRFLAELPEVAASMRPAVGRYRESVLGLADVVREINPDRFPPLPRAGTV